MYDGLRQKSAVANCILALCRYQLMDPLDNQGRYP